MLPISFAVLGQVFSPTNVFMAERVPCGWRPDAQDLMHVNIFSKIRTNQNSTYLNTTNSEWQGGGGGGGGGRCCVARV